MREHYPIVGVALLKTFESYLGTDWTPKVKQAWTNAYGVIVNLMLEGAKYPEEVSKLEYALQQGAKPVVMAKAPTQAPVSVSSLNYGTEKSKLENVSQPHVKPVGSSQKTISAPTSASSLNLKLLLLVLVIASLLGSFTTISIQNRTIVACKALFQKLQKYSSFLELYQSVQYLWQYQ